MMGIILNGKKNKFIIITIILMLLGVGIFLSFNNKLEEDLVMEAEDVFVSNTINGVTIEMEVNGDTVFDDRVTIGKVVTVTAYFPEQVTGNKTLTLEVPEGLEYDVNGVPVPIDYVNPGGVQDNILNELGEGQPLAQQAINTVTLPAMDTVTNSTFGSVTYVLNETADKIILTFYVKADEKRVYGTHDILGHLTARATFNDTQVSTYIDVSAASSEMSSFMGSTRDHEFAADKVVASMDSEILYNYATSAFRPEYLPYVTEGTFKTYYPVGMEYVALVTYNTTNNNNEYVKYNVVDNKETGEISYSISNNLFYAGSTAKYKIPVGMEEGIYTTTGVPVIEFTTFDGVEHIFYPGNVDMDGDGNIDEGYIYSTEEVVSRESFGAPLTLSTSYSSHDLYQSNYSNTGFMKFANVNPFRTKNIMFHVVVDPNYLAKVVRLPRGTNPGLVQYKTTKNDEWQTFTITSNHYLHLDANTIGLESDEYITEVYGNIGTFSANRQSYANSSINYHTNNIIYGIQKPGVTEVKHSVSAWIENDKENTLVTMETYDGLNTSLVNMTTDGRSVVYKDGVEVTAITAGDTLHVESQASIQGYLYGYSFIIEDPYFILRETNGITLHPSTFKVKNDLTGEDLDFNVDYIVSEDGTQDNYYKITLLDEMTMGFMVGYPSKEVNMTVSYDFTTNPVTTESYVFNIAGIFSFLQDGATGRSYLSGNNNWENGLDLNNNGRTTDVLPSTGSYLITVNKNNHVIVDTYLSLSDGTRYPAYMPAYPETSVNFTPGLTTNYNISIQNLSAYDAKDFVLYFPIPKEGDNFGVNYQSEAFTYNMKLTDYLADMPGFTVEYGTGITADTILNGNYVTNPSDLNSVNMIRITGESTITQGNSIDVTVPLEIDETLETSTGKIGTMNIFNPYYTVDYTVYAGWKKGSAVGAKLVLMNIEGDLFEDNNFNGIKDEGDSALSNVVVELYRKQLDGSYLPVLDGENVKSVVTDVNGHYQFIHQDMSEIAEYKIVPIMTSYDNYVATNYKAVVDYIIDSDLQIGSDGVINIDPTSDEATYINMGFIEKQNLEIDMPNLLILSPREAKQYLLIDTSDDASGIINPHYFELLGGEYDVSANKNVLEVHTFTSGNEYLSITGADISTTDILKTDLLFSLSDRYDTTSNKSVTVLIVGEDRLINGGMSALDVTLTNKEAKGITSEELVDKATALAYSTVSGEELVISGDVTELNGVDHLGGSYIVTLTTTEGSLEINVNVEEGLKTDASLSDIKIDDVTIEGFNSSTYSYNISVPFATSSINLDATLNDIDASTTFVNGVKDLVVGSNSFVIEVVSEDPDVTSTYTVNVTRELNSDNFIKTVSVLGHEGSWSGMAYMITVDAADDSFTADDILITVGEGATYEIGTGMDLEYGYNLYLVKVTAQNGVGAYNQIRITRAYKTDASLSDITVDGSTITDFNSDTYTYNLTVGYDVDSINLNALTTDLDASILESDLGVKGLNVGNNVFEINVTAHDSKTKQKYTVNINREKNDNNDLNSLTVAGVDAVWNITTDAYQIEVNENVTRINPDDIIGIVDETAEFNAGDGIDLEYGGNTYKVSVTAQNGTVKEYVIYINRDYKKDATLSDIKINDVTIDNFNKDTYSYEITVPYNIDSINLKATLSDSDASYEQSDVGDKELIVGENIFEINVTAHFFLVNQTYTIKVIREENSDNNLNSLSILGVTATWNATNSYYEVTLPSNTTSITADDILTEVDSTATVNEGSGMSLNYGVNDYLISVTSQNGIVKNFSVKINRAHKTDASVSDIKVDGSTISGFNSDTFNYNLTVGYDVESITVEALTSDSDASILLSDLGVKNLSVGVNVIEINVTAHDSSTKQIYTLNVTREENSNNDLNSLTILGEVAIWNSDLSRYEVTLGSDVSNLTSSDFVGSVDDTATFGTTDIALGYGSNNHVVSVEAQNGSVKEYDVVIIRSYKSNALLNSILIDDIEISNFSSNTFSYDIVVNYDVDSINLNALVSDSDATILSSDLGVKALNVGENVIEINVTAHDAVTKQVYTLNITREEDSNNSLNGLTILGESAVWNNDLSRYEVTLDSEITSFTKDDVVGSVSDTATFIASEKSNLGYGNNDYTVSVQAMDGSIANYDVVIIRSYKSDASVSDITIDGNTITEFSSDVYVYNLTVGYDVDSVTVNALVNDSDASILSSDLGVKNLSVGVNVIEINVTAHNGVTKQVYTLNITREENSNNDLNSLTILGEVAVYNTEFNRYDVTLGSEISRILSDEITGSVDSTATFNPGLGLDLKYGENGYKVSVEAMDGSIKEYSVVINREYKSNALLNSILIDEVEISNFSSNTFSYDITVDYDTTSINLNALVSDSDATILSSDLGVKNLSVGENVIEINVTAHNAVTKQTYTLNITRSQDTNSSLNSLSILGEVAIYNDIDKRYEIVVDSTISSISSEQIVGSVADTATFNPGLGLELVYGNNNYVISVEAMDGSISNYNVLIFRSYKTNALLDSILIDDILITGFSSNTFTYDINVSNDTDSINLDALVSDSDALITSELGIKNLSVGENVIVINVTAHDSVTKQIYTLNINRLKSSENGIKSLVILDVVPSWNEENSYYELNLPATNSVILETDVDIVLDSSLASVDLKGGISLDYGINTYTFTVMAEDGSVKEYVVKINRAYKNNASLNSISIDGNIIEGFVSDKVVYDITVDYGVSNINLSALTSDLDASITSSLGNKSLELGLNTISIDVLAHDSITVKTYTLNITRLRNSNNDISGLKVFGIDTIYNNISGQYEVSVDGTDSTLNMSDITVIIDDTATLNNSPEMNLVFGENVYRFSVTAQNGEVKNYEILVNRPLKNIATLSSITIDDNVLDGFDSTIYTYNLEVPYETVSIDLQGVLSDVDASVTGVGIKSLELGNNTFVIEVTAHDRVTKLSYTININRIEVDDELLEATIDSGYVINGNYIEMVKAETTGLAFKNNLINDNSNLYIYESDGTTLVGDDSIVKTGMIVKLIKNGKELDSKEIIVVGDPNGDGVINLFDSMLVINVYLEKEVFSDAYKMAADINKNGVVDLFDSMAIINHYLQVDFLY